MDTNSQIIRIIAGFRQPGWSKMVLDKQGSGGEGGIRTLDTVSRIHAFQACAFNHSATSPAACARRTQNFTRRRPLRRRSVRLQSLGRLFNRKRRGTRGHWGNEHVAGWLKARDPVAPVSGPRRTGGAGSRRSSPRRLGEGSGPRGRRIRARRRNIAARPWLASRNLRLANRSHPPRIRRAGGPRAPPAKGVRSPRRPARSQSRRRSLMEVLERVCSSTRFTITAQ